MRRVSVLLLTCMAVLAFTVPSMAGVLHSGLAKDLAHRPDTEFYKVIVRLADRADVVSLNAQLKREGATLALRHQQVVEALQTVANDSQPRMTDYLQKQVMSGEVRDFRTFWIENIIGVEATVREIKKIAQRPEVEMVYIDYIIETIAPVENHKVRPTEPPKEGQAVRAVEPGIAAIKAPEAWALGYTGLGRVIANMDTGVDGNHEALASRWRGLTEPAAQCWYDPVTSTTFPFDSGSHGTHTMGTIAGYTAVNEIGVAKDAQWIAAGVIDRVDIPTTMTDAVAAFQWFADPDGNPGTVDDVPDGVGNSWGISPIYHGSYITGPCDVTFWTAIDNCEAAGCAVIFSAGNEGPTVASLRTPGDRADSPYNAFSVGSVDANGAFPYPISSFSSLGPGCNDEIKPEVVAPGDNIRSSVPGSSYSTMSGTSMASPHVTGSVAVLRQVDPNLDVDTIKDILLTTAVDLGTTGEDNTYGMGIIDLEQAVIYASQGFGTVQGNVSDSGTAAPIPARVEELSSGRIVYANAVTGDYSMSAAGDQSYTFEATYFGYLPQQQVAYVPVDGTVTVDFTLDPAPAGILQGTVTDLEGAPIDGAVISVLGTPLAPATTNASGFYQFTTIPGGSTYTIHVAAIGYGDEMASVFVPVGDTVVQDFSLTPAEAFEISDGNYTGSGEWEWGEATVGPSAAHSGLKLWGTDLDAAYNNSALYTLDSREYSLNDPGAALGFYHWRSIETGYDGGNVKLSTDGGGTWTLLLPDGGYPDDSIVGLGEPGFTGSGDWELVTFDLGAYLGQTVIFRWTFGTDSSVAYDGWYIDDVIVWGASSELLLPDMVLSASEIHLYADPGGTASETLTFTNNGDGYLNFSISAAVDSGAASGSGGPDTYGYSWRDSDEAGGPTYGWVDITGIGTQILGLGDDTNVGPYDIGFSFNYYGSAYTQFQFCTNGWISFSSTLISYSNTTLPNGSAPLNMLAPFWDDQTFTSGGEAYYYSDGSRLIVSWINVPHYSTGGPYNYQVILGSDGSMVFQYDTMAAPLDSATIGIQNGDGTDGLQVVYNAAYMHDSLAIEFATGWLSTDPAGGQVPALGSMPVSVIGDASDLDTGDYTGSLTINSNDPVTPTVVIPVTFHVGAGANTVSASLGCQPASGVVPFVAQFTAGMANLTSENRRAAGTIEVIIASGSSYKNWRAGWTNLSPSENFTLVWNQSFPALGTLIGINSFNLQVTDVTPAPYNQPPYAPDGDTASAGCTVTGVAP